MAFLFCTGYGQDIGFERGGLAFKWDVVKDEARVMRGMGQVWRGGLLPAFWLETGGRKMFVKATATGVKMNSAMWNVSLRLGELGKGTLSVMRETWGLRFAALEVEWAGEPPAIIEMYFGADDKDLGGSGVAASWDRPFLPDWQSFGYCVPGGKEGPAQSYFRMWDMGQTNIALGAFGPSLGTPYGAAYPKPVYFAGMGSADGFMAIGAGSIPDGAMSFRVQATRYCFQYVYREDLWGALQGRRRRWTEPLRISLGRTAYEAFADYYRGFPAKASGIYVRKEAATVGNAGRKTGAETGGPMGAGGPMSAGAEPPAFFNTWGLWKERDYGIAPVADLARRVGSTMLVLDDGWESSQGSGTVNTQRFPHLAEELKTVHEAGMGHGLWETLGWIGDTAAAGLTSADLIVDKNGRPCKANWNFDPASPSYYCLDISSAKTREFLKQRTIRQMEALRPKLLKLDFGYGLPSPSMGVPRDPAYRGERQHVEMIRTIAAAARSVDPGVCIMYYGISPLGLDAVDMISLDDQGDLWYDIAGGHGEWSVWASLLSDKHIAVSGSSGYSWELDDEVLLNTVVIGSPSAVLPMKLAGGKPVPDEYLLRRRAVHAWYRRTVDWRPLWLNSSTGGLDGPPRLRSWGRVEGKGADTAVTALALREGSGIRGIQWTGRWALLSRDHKDIAATDSLAVIPFDEGEIRLPYQARPAAVSVTRLEGLVPFTDWQWESGVLTLRAHHSTGGILVAAGQLAPLQPVAERNLLRKYTAEDIRATLIPKDKWLPFPRSAEKWRVIVPDSIREKIISAGEQYLGKPFASLSATLYLDFQRTGSRTRFEDASFGKRAQLFSMVLAESMEGKGRFMDAIMDGVWSFCEESFWGIPAHYYLQRAGLGLPDVAEPSVDIFASETSEILALTDYLVGPKLDSLSPLLRRRIYDEVNRRILKPLAKDSIPYHYLGPSRKDAPVNNWDPWVVSNWMISLLLLEKDERVRATELHHGMVLLDNYINGLGDDGAVDEGPSYWSGGAGRLFDALRMLDDATAGRVNIYDAPVLGKLGAYIRRMHIAGNYFISIADASPTIAADAILICRIGKALKDPDLQQFGAWAWKHLDDHNFYTKDWSKPRILWNLLSVRECAGTEAILPANADVWFPNLQLMAGAAGPGGLFLATHAGHNGESHNHNDVGDFMVYSEGEPVIVDVGFGTYNAKTFSKDRYQLWYLNSAHHNVPLINGYEQLATERYGARSVSYSGATNKLRLDMDIARAYPDEAGIRRWMRSVQLDKGRNKVTVTDDFALDRRQGVLSQTFMTICPVDLGKPGRILFRVPGHRSVLLQYDAAAWDVQKEEMSTKAPDEKRIADNWGHRAIYRLLLTSKTKDTRGKFTYTITQL